jgi:hypothetical protein
MEGAGYAFEQSDVDTSAILTAAITSLQNDEYIPPRKCEEFLSQIEGLLAEHQEFVSSQFLPNIDAVKSLLPLNKKSPAGTMTSPGLHSYPTMLGAGELSAGWISTSSSSEEE